MLTKVCDGEILVVSLALGHIEQVADARNEVVWTSPAGRCLALRVGLVSVRHCSGTVACQRVRASRVGRLQNPSAAGASIAHVMEPSYLAA